MPTQLMAAHLPLLVHPAPRHVFVLGLGSGVTAAAVLAYPVDSVDGMELEPAVIEASRFFAAAQGRSLADPRFRLVVGDGRSFLRATAARYDVIISEPSNPWIQGMAALFSVEFFTQARERLRPGGVMLQWLQTYNLAPEDLRMVVATFRSVFPAASVWQSFAGDLLLIGRMEASPLDLRNVRARWEALSGLRADFERMSMGNWAGMLGSFVLGEADTARLADGARLNTDDRLPLEWNAPRSIYLDTTPANVALLSSYRRAMLPDLVPGSERELDRAEVQYWMGIVALRRPAWPRPSLIREGSRAGCGPRAVGGGSEHGRAHAGTSRRCARPRGAGARPRARGASGALLRRSRVVVASAEERCPALSGARHRARAAERGVPWCPRAPQGRYTVEVNARGVAVNPIPEVPVSESSVSEPAVSDPMVRGLQVPEEDVYAEFVKRDWCDGLPIVSHPSGCGRCSRGLARTRGGILGVMPPLWRDCQHREARGQRGHGGLRARATSR